MFYNLLTYEYSESCIVLPFKHYQEVTEHTNSLKLIVQSGRNKYTAQVSCDDTLPESMILISSCLQIMLSLPLELQYQIVFNPSLVIIGPAIGLLLEKRHNDLTASFLANSQNYLAEYPCYGGLVFVFSLEGINFHAKKVKGFYYSPMQDTEVWKEGVFPLPSAIFRRIGIKKSLLDQLARLTGNKIFNSYYFDKWGFYSLVPQGHSLCEYLPETALFSSGPELNDFITRYGSAYLKPADGTKGAGIFYVQETGDGYEIRSIHQKSKCVVNSEKFKSWFQKSKHRGRYLVQQPIKSIRFKKRLVDFRVIMQKNGRALWQCTCILARAGRIRGITSNFQAAGFLLEGKKFLLEKLKLNHEQTDYILSELKRVAILVCCCLDESGGNYGDLGLDLAVDDSYKVWLIEVNKRHDHLMPLYAGERFIYSRVKTNPVNYAVYLAGFNHIY